MLHLFNFVNLSKHFLKLLKKFLTVFWVVSWFFLKILSPTVALLGMYQAGRMVFCLQSRNGSQRLTGDIPHICTFECWMKHSKQGMKTVTLQYFSAEVESGMFTCVICLEIRLGIFISLWNTSPSSIVELNLMKDICGIFLQK